MKHLLTRCMTAIAILTILAMPARLAAAQATPQYIAIDLGTLGGPYAFVDTPSNVMSPNGVIVGDAATPTQDVAFRWQKGVMTALGTLPGGDFSAAFEENGTGVTVGDSDNGTLDPLTGLPEVHAVTWRLGHITDFGTLGGTQSWAGAINSQGQIAGAAANSIPDQYICAFGPIPFCPTTQLHAFIGQNGHMQDLGTLGGPDSVGGLINDRGQVAGESFTNSVPNPTTGTPTLDPFLWQNGHMQDLGGLGGTTGFANWINSTGEVAGQSDLAGDQSSHPFLWNGRRLMDLHTLGGDNGTARWINDAGQVVGSADIPGSQAHHGFLWQNGSMTDLPPVGGAPCSNAFGINNQGEVAGNTTDCQGNSQGAMLWENGSAYDLNALVVNWIAPSPLFLTEPAYIDNRGEIVSYAVDSSGNPRVALLVPASTASSLGLSSKVTTGPATSTARTATVRRNYPDPRDILGPIRDRLSARYHFRVQ